MVRFISCYDYDYSIDDLYLWIFIDHNRNVKSCVLLQMKREENQVNSRETITAYNSSL